MNKYIFKSIWIYGLISLFHSVLNLGYTFFVNIICGGWACLGDNFIFIMGSYTSILLSLFLSVLIILFCVKIKLDFGAGQYNKYNLLLLVSVIVSIFIYLRMFLSLYLPFLTYNLFDFFNLI